MKDKMRLGAKSASTMSRETALQLAVTAWCGEKTKNKVMDPELAFEFARILQREVNLRLHLEWIENNSLMSAKEKQEAKDWLMRGLDNNKYVPKN